jgi:putative flippase GtrA
MHLVRRLSERLRHLAPEAFAFGVIGAVNTVLYMTIVAATMSIGAVKANVIASVITTTLSYLANRHWTYKHRPRSALRREYTLFFTFNFAGMVIQSGAVAFAKYGLGLSEDQHRLALLAFTVVGIGLATVFRFWAYRTVVFLKHPVDAGHALDGHAIAEMDPVAELAEALSEPDAARDGHTAEAARTGHGAAHAAHTVDAGHGHGAAHTVDAGHGHGAARPAHAHDAPQRHPMAGPLPELAGADELDAELAAELDAARRSATH